LNSNILDALQTCTRSVTKQWQEAKRNADRQNRVQRQALERLRKAQKQRELSIKDAAYIVMHEAYMKASANNTLPANARQIMYAARPLVLQLRDTYWKNSSQFTQHYLPDYMELYEEETKDWDVVFDARGKLIEPHTKERVDLGTLEVRNYIAEWHDDVDETLDIELQHGVPTMGPANRYKFVLFIEKEGFDPLLKQARIAERYDIAIMSTKGMSVTAARTLVERLSRKQITILVLRDFDKAGFSIVHKLQANTRRYRFSTRPNVIDLGLRLEDVRAMNLESEVVEYDSKVNPRFNLSECGATKEECDFLVEGRTYSGWIGARVELNAMTSEQFLTWLETKLETHGVQKVVPDQSVLEKAYRRAWKRAIIQEAIDRATEDVGDDEIIIPPNLDALVRDKLQKSGQQAWDDALWAIVYKDRHDYDDAE
jgi:hypothetical protein